MFLRENELLCFNRSGKLRNLVELTYGYCV